VIEKDGVHTTRYEITVRVHVVVIRNRNDSPFALCIEQEVVSHRGSESRDLASLQVGETPNTRPIFGANREHFTKFEIRKSDGATGSKSRPVLYSRHSDIKVAALGRRLDRRPGHLNELRAPIEPFGDHPRNFHIETSNLRWIGRVGFDERSSAFSVAAPFERRT